jgi:hypothetical protein
MQTLLTLFLSMNEPPPEGWDCLASVETPLMLTVSLPDYLRAGDSNAVYMLMDCGDSAGYQRDIADGYICHCLVADCHTTGGTGTHAEEIQARARAMFASQAKPKVLPHPWAREVTATDLIEDCQRRTDPALHVLESWKLTSGTCSPDGITLLYQIMPGGTVEGFWPAPGSFRCHTCIQSERRGREASYTGSPDRPLKDEAVPDSSTQLIRILSWFQRQQITLNITDVAMPQSCRGERRTASCAGLAGIRV